MTLDYGIITVSSEYFKPTVTEILNMVSEKCKEGYKPCGGLSGVERGGIFYFAQAMIKEE